MLDHSVFSKIKCFVLDVDGVLTNANVLVTESGELLRTMNVRDGQAIKFALNAGYRIAIFTKGGSTGVKKRLQGLGITDIFDRLESKEATFDQYVMEQQLDLAEVAYMGDDLPDLPLLDRVGLPSCPFDAAEEVLLRSNYISSYKGGKGCVRDLIRRTMHVQGTWPGLGQ